MAEFAADPSCSGAHRQATESALKLMQSGAFAHMMQGMLKNYTEFLTEFSQSGMALMNQGQVAITRQVQEATDTVIDATEARGRRVRQVGCAVPPRRVRFDASRTSRVGVKLLPVEGRWKPKEAVDRIVATLRETLLVGG